MQPTGGPATTSNCMRQLIRCLIPVPLQRNARQRSEARLRINIGGGQQEAQRQADSNSSGVALGPCRYKAVMLALRQYTTLLFTTKFSVGKGNCAHAM